MPAPLIPLIGAATGGALAGGIGVGLAGDDTPDTKKQKRRAVDQSTTDIDAPQITDARTDARQVSFSPTVQVRSPNARGATTQQRQRARARVRSRPQTNIPITREPDLSSESDEGISNQTLIIAGGLIGGGLILNEVL